MSCAHRRLRARAAVVVRARPAAPGGGSRQEQRRHDVADTSRAPSRTAPEDADQDPARPGPRICDGCRVISSLELPSTSWSRSTTRRQVALVGDVEEHGEAAVDEADDVQLPDRQGVEGERDRDRHDRHRPAQVATIRIGRRRRRSTQTPAGRLSRMNGRNSIVVSSPNSNGADVQDRGGDQRQGELRDRDSEDRDGLRGPELEEVGVAEEAAARSAGHRGGESTASAVGAIRSDRARARGRSAARAGPVASATCSSKACPTSPRAGGREVVERLAAALTSVPGRVPARPDLRRQPQPLGVHGRRRARGGRRRAWSASSSTAIDEIDMERAQRASTRGSAPWTSSRSSRSATRRWTTAWSSPGGSGSGSPTAGTCPCTSTPGRRRARTG